MVRGYPCPTMAPSIPLPWKYRPGGIRAEARGSQIGWLRHRAALLPGQPGGHARPRGARGVLNPRGRMAIGGTCGDSR